MRSLSVEEKEVATPNVQRNVTKGVAEDKVHENVGASYSASPDLFGDEVLDEDELPDCWGTEDIVEYPEREGIVPPEDPNNQSYYEQQKRNSMRRKAVTTHQLLAHHEHNDNCPGCQAKARNKKHFKQSFQREKDEYDNLVTMDQVTMVDMDGTLGIGGLRSRWLFARFQRIIGTSYHCGRWPRRRQIGHSKSFVLQSPLE